MPIALVNSKTNDDIPKIVKQDICSTRGMRYTLSHSPKVSYSERFEGRHRRYGKAKLTQFNASSLVCICINAIVITVSIITFRSYNVQYKYLFICFKTCHEWRYKYNRTHF